MDEPVETAHPAGDRRVTLVSVTMSTDPPIWSGPGVLLTSKGRSFGGQPIILEETSSDPPAVTGWNDGLLLAWTGSDHHINVGLLHRH